MQLSHYIKIYAYGEKPGYCLVYSTKKASAVLLHEATVKSIEKGKLSPENKATLVRLGILVPDVEAEKREMAGHLDAVNKRKSKCNVVAVMNLDCNLACTYCFEGTMKGKKYMRRDTAESVVGYAERVFRKGRDVNIVFYGGEPLLSADLIGAISERICGIAELSGKNYSFSMVTNGTLFSRKRAEKLAAAGLKSVKITLDGPAHIHNRQRPFRTGAGSFDVILKNMKETCELVRMQVGGNFTRNNYRMFPELLDYLVDAGLRPDHLSAVKFDPVTRFKGEYALPDFSEGCESLDEQWLYEAGIFLREEILKRGFHTPKITPSPCMMELRGDIVINYDGTVYTCPAMIGMRDFQAGNIMDDTYEYRMVHNPDSWKNEECLDCEYLPLCFGGCRFMRFQKHGGIDGIDCKKAYLEAVLEAMVKMDIRYGNVKKEMSSYHV